jgi:hypothetical protein
MPAVGDVDNDGVKEIVVASVSGKVYVINANGTVRAGWPVTLPAPTQSTPALGDIDGDGFPDVVVGFKFVDPTGTGGRGGVRAYTRTGSLIWEKLTQTDQGNDGVFSTPAIGDIDGDGQNEVAFGAFDMRIYVVRRNGSDQAGWPKFVRDSSWSSPALFDLNGDGTLEVIIGVDTHLEGPPYNTPDGGALYVFKHDGTVYHGFPAFIDQTMMSSPAVGDIDDDGLPEIVVGGGTYYTGAVGRKVYAYNCDGSTVTGWPVSTDAQVFDSPALADLDNDGTLDVIVPDESYNLYAFRGTGAQMFKMVPKGFFGVTLSADSPIVADISGDGVPEVMVAVNTEIAVVSNTGVQLTDDGTHPPGAKSYYMPTTTRGAVVSDLDNDGTIEVIAGSATPFPDATNGQVYVWNPAAATSMRPWPAFHQDPMSRRGVAPGTASCPDTSTLDFFTITPCRVVDTRNPIGPLGGPALVSGTTREFAVAGHCGVPADARAVSTNVTVTGSTSFGDLRLYPTGTQAPISSTLNWAQGRTRANNAVVGVGTGGSISVWCVMGLPTATTHAIIDVNGYFK